MYKAHTYVLWQGNLDTLKALLREAPETFGAGGGRALWRVRLALWEREPDTLLALLGAPSSVTFETQGTYEPGHLYAGWAHQLRDDRAGT